MVSLKTENGELKTVHSSGLVSAARLSTDADGLTASGFRADRLKTATSQPPRETEVEASALRLATNADGLTISGFRADRLKTVTSQLPRGTGAGASSCLVKALRLATNAAGLTISGFRADRLGVAFTLGAVVFVLLNS